MGRRMFVKEGEIREWGEYRFMKKKGHPRANKSGYVREHLIVAEKMIGRHLIFIGNNHPDNEVVHHIDHNKKNNNPNNLHICSSRKHHKIENTLIKLAHKLIRHLEKRGKIGFDREKGEYYLRK
jgi:hypothetical protein